MEPGTHPVRVWTRIHFVSKTVKTPDFLHESSQSGAFCISAAILIYLQVLLPIFSISGGDRAATTEEDTEF